MKKEIACMCLKVGKYAKKEAEKQIKAILRKRGVKSDKIKTAAKKVAKHGMKIAREMQKIAIAELKKTMQKTSKRKKVKKKK